MVAKGRPENVLGDRDVSGETSVSWWSELSALCIKAGENCALFFAKTNVRVCENRRVIIDIYV